MTAPLQYGSPPAGDPTAVMGRRTLAWIADLLLFLAVVAAGFASMGEYVDVPPGIDDPCQVLQDQADASGEGIGSCLDFRDMGVEDAEDRVYLLNTDESGLQTLLSLGWFAFFVVLQGLTGGSPGKLLFGLRVVDQYGAKAGIGKSLGRTLMWIVDAAPWIIPLVGAITAFTSTGHRRVGDLAAGTYVVSASGVGQPVMPGNAPIPAGQTAWGAAPPTSPPPMGQSWQSPPSAAPTSTGPGWQTGGGVPWTPPTVDAGPGLGVEPTPAVREIDERAGADRADAPEWTAPTLPDVEDPAESWQPPSAPADDWADAPQQQSPTPPAAPFAAPGAEGPPTSPPGASSAPEPPPAPRYELPPPQWDPARGTYLQWEPNRQAWLQWDATTQRWKPIDT